MGSGVSKSDDSTLRRGTVAPACQSADNLTLNMTVDNRLPFSQFRELYTLKNYFKTVRRNEKQCAKFMYYKYINFNIFLLLLNFYNHFSFFLLNYICNKLC